MLKSLLFGVASDSQKHSALLKGIAESIARKEELSTKDCEMISETLATIHALSEEISTKKEISEEELQEFIGKLEALESTCGEEYSVFVQLKTLELMSKEINRLYNINIDNLKDIFQGIISDEEHHREIIETIKELLCERRDTKINEDPLSEYRKILHNK
jgi:hypothetical protein